MNIIWRKPWQAFSFAFLLLSSSVLLCPCTQASVTETPEEAIRRIQAGQHTPIPAPTTAPASGPEGKGMTVENTTGYTVRVYFSGPASRKVVVPDRRSESVDLSVGEYQIAAEVPDSPIVPFYGRQAYQPSTHYWLKFYTQRVESAPQRVESAPQQPELNVTTNTGDKIAIRNAFMDYTPRGPHLVNEKYFEPGGITAIQGGGNVAVRWDRIAEVRITGFKSVKDRRILMAEIVLRDGKEVAIGLRSGFLVGETDLGKWEIDISEVKAIAPIKPD